MAERFNARVVTDQLSHQLADLRRDVEVIDNEIKRADLVQVLQRLAVAEDRVTELKRVREEADKRHWQFVYIFAGAMASLLVTVVVQLVLAMVKK